MLNLEQILKLPVSEIERNGYFFLTVIREWRRLTGKEPALCGCDGRANINYVKNYYNKPKKDDMKPNIYFQGAYFHSDSITDEQKNLIKNGNPNLFAKLAEKYGWEVEPEPVTVFTTEDKPKNKRKKK
jgi:hypothetical protein